MAQPWEDQGLYFALVFNAIVMVVLIMLAYLIYRFCARVTRPNRPGSRTATFFREPAALFSFNEDEVLHTVGPTAATHTLVLKLFALSFLVMLWTCVIIVALCATDDYLRRWRSETDPDQCADKDEGECNDSVKCDFFPQPVTIFGREANCQPAPRRGLFDLSIANVTPGEKWRLYIIGIVIALSALPLFFVVHAVVRELKRLIRRSYTMPVSAHLPCGGLASVGARTVLIGGLPKDAAMLGDKSKVVAFLRADQHERSEMLKETVPKESLFDRARGAIGRGSGHSGGANGGSNAAVQQNQSSDEREMPLLSDLKAPSHVIARDRLIDSTLVVIREPPKNIESLMDDEKKALDKLENAVAEERFETDPKKKPVMTRVPPNVCKKRPAVEYWKHELAQTREKLEKKLAKRGEQDMAGAVVATFDRPSSAFAFVRQFNKEQGITGNAQARILGPREGVVWSNLGVTRMERRVRALITVAVFTWLVFFWAVPVGFLGNLDKLEGLPGVGPAFGSALNVMPTAVRGALAAYLPVIVLALFNLLLPLIFATFSKFGGAKNEYRVDRSVLVMCAIFSIMSGVVLQAVLQGGFTQLIALVQDPSGQAVLDLLVGLVSPQGGYWYALLISAAAIGSFVRLCLFGPVILSMVLGKMAKGRQKEYDDLFEPRDFNYAYHAGRQLFFVSIGMFFFATVAFLQPFAAAYAVAVYYTERSLFIDGAKPNKVPVVFFSMVLPFLHGVLALHTVGAVGAVAVLALKKCIGAPIIASIALAANLMLHWYVRKRLHRIVRPSPELVAELEREMDQFDYPRQKISEVDPYVPDYALHEIDYDAESRIESAEYQQVDKTWPKEDTELVRDPPPICCCLGEDENAHDGIDGARRPPSYGTTVQMERQQSLPSPQLQEGKAGNPQPYGGPATHG